MLLHVSIVRSPFLPPFRSSSISFGEMVLNFINMERSLKHEKILKAAYK